MTPYWNPRFVAYAEAHGRTPEAQLAHDEQAWPGGKMAGYTLWLTKQWDRFVDTIGKAPTGMTEAEWRSWVAMIHSQNFDAWLTTERCGPGRDAR